MIPLRIRAMVLAGKTLFVAGPPDFINEDEVAAGNIADPKLLEQLAAMLDDLHLGKLGADFILGDMLVVTAREPRPERIQGAFVSESEVHDVVAWCREQRTHAHKEAKVFEAASISIRSSSRPSLMARQVEHSLQGRSSTASALKRCCSSSSIRCTRDSLPSARRGPSRVRISWAR